MINLARKLRRMRGSTASRACIAPPSLTSPRILGIFDCRTWASSTPAHRHGDDGCRAHRTGGQRLCRRRRRRADWLALLPPPSCRFYQTARQQKGSHRPWAGIPPPPTAKDSRLGCLFFSSSSFFSCAFFSLIPSPGVPLTLTLSFLHSLQRSFHSDTTIGALSSSLTRVLTCES